MTEFLYEDVLLTEDTEPLDTVLFCHQKGLFLSLCQTGLKEGVY